MLDSSDKSQQTNKVIVRQPRQYLDDLSLVFIHDGVHLLLLIPPEVAPFYQTELTRI